jgi:preprotein translocase subunit YajC
MKAATGELNLTVITIIAIAAIMAFFWFMWSRDGGIQDTINNQWDDVNNPNAGNSTIKPVG